MTWSRKFPTKAGYYWFYGRVPANPPIDYGTKNEFHLIEVFVTGSAEILKFKSDDGYWLSPKDKDCVGVWQQITVPGTPQKEDITDE